jgi:hypothetical protein
MNATTKRPRIESPQQAAVAALVRDQRDQDRAQAQWAKGYAVARRAHRAAAAQTGRAKILRDRVLVRDGELVMDLAQQTVEAYEALTAARLTTWQQLHTVGLEQGWIQR